MPLSVRNLAIACAAAGCIAMTLSAGAAAQTRDSQPNPTPTQTAVPPLQLSDAQHAQIREALAGENTAVSFAFKSSKSVQSFEPAVGIKLPKGITPHALPRPLIYQLPLLQQYKYVKFKQQILIVNPVSNQIVDLFPQA